MIVVYTLIGFSLLTSAFFTIFSLVGAICGWFGLHLEIESIFPWLDEEWWKERKEKRRIVAAAKSENQIQTEMHENDVDVLVSELEKKDVDTLDEDFAESIDNMNDIEFDELTKRLADLGI